MHEALRQNSAQYYHEQGDHDKMGHKPWVTVMQVLPALNTGGVERGTLDVAEAIILSGGRALVVSQGGLLQEELEQSGAEHIKMPVASKNPFMILWNANKLKDLIRAYGVDVIHARSRAPAWSAYLAAKACGIPFVTSHHGIYSDGLWGWKKFYNAIMWKSDKIIAVSQEIRERLLQKHHVAKDKVVLIHRGVDTVKFDPYVIEPQKIMDYFEQHNLPQDKRFVLLAGRISRWKGMEDLIRAMQLVQTPDLMALIVGPSQADDSYAFQLEKEIMQLKLQDRVRILPDCQDMPHLYSLASIVISASKLPEPFGRITAEGMAMQRPVLAPQHGGAAEQIIHEQTGWLFEPNNIQDLAAGIDYIAGLTDQHLEALGYEARLHVCTNFSKQQMVNATLDVYASLLENRIS